MSPLSAPSRVAVHVTTDLIAGNDDAKRGRVLVHGGLTDAGMPADGCIRCGAVIRVWLSVGRWLLWCDHSPAGWQHRRDDQAQEAAA